MITCQSCAVPRALALTKPLAPLPMWQLAHAAFVCAGPCCHCTKCGVIGV